MALSNKYWAALELGMGVEKKYPEFEAHCLKAASDYYSTKASAWMLEYSCLDYLLKADECLKKEEDIGSHYLKSTSLPKLMQRVRHELLSMYSTQLIENEQSGFLALLKNDKVEILSRMYRLFFRIPRAPGRMAAIYKQHVVTKGMALFKQAEDAVGNRKVSVPFIISRILYNLRYNTLLYLFCIVLLI